MTITRTTPVIPESAIWQAAQTIADFFDRPNPTIRDRELSRRVLGSVSNILGAAPLDLPAPKNYRETDPPTTVAAAIDGLGRFSNQRSRMLLVFARDEARELKGLNADQAGELAQMTNGCYWKRFSELRHLGLIEDTGEKRKGHAGVDQMVCRLTVWGEVAVAAIKGAA